MRAQNRSGAWRLVVAGSAALLCLVCGCEDDAAAPLSLQDRILREGRVDWLTDAVYMLPVHSEEWAAPRYAALRRWDILFGGAALNFGPLDAGAIIPGRYDHMMVYVGKDAEGFAYVVELNVDDIRMVFGQVVVEGGIRMFCFGTDYGETTHPSGQRHVTGGAYRYLSAANWTEDARRLLDAAGPRMAERVRDDLQANFPFQLHLEISATDAMAGQGVVQLIDDGRVGGAGCSDYWTSLWEDFAGLCLKGARMTAAELTDYYQNDPVGRTARLPGRLNPLGSDPIYLHALPDYGVVVLDPSPHVYPCDGSSEVGILLPDRIRDNPLLSIPLELAP